MPDLSLALFVSAEVSIDMEEACCSLKMEHCMPSAVSGTSVGQDVITLAHWLWLSGHVALLLAVLHLTLIVNE